TVSILRENLQRLRLQLWREVDHVVGSNALTVEGGRLRGEGLRRRRLLGRHIGRRNRPLLDWPQRLTGHAIEDIQERLFRDLRNRLDSPPARGDVQQDRL